MIVCADFFYDGGFAVIGPYMAEVWPTRLRTTGMGSAYGFGGIGKIIGPLGLALMIGASDVIKPQATVAAIVPGFLYFAGMDGVVRLRVPVLRLRDRAPVADRDRRGAGKRGRHATGHTRAIGRLTRPWPTRPGGPRKGHTKPDCKAAWSRCWHHADRIPAERISI